jgi:hypothetical protein
MRLGLLTVAASLALVGCAARAKTAAANPATMKPATPAPPPAPVKLSTPQTQVELPRPQPYDSTALDTVQAAPSDTNANKPATPAPPPRPVARPVRTETPPPVVSAPTETARPPMQEIIPQTDLKRLQESAQGRKREVAGILEQFQGRRLSKPLQIKLGEINNFVKLSDDFEKRGEMRQADAMAEKAQILARQLPNGH